MKRLYVIVSLDVEEEGLFSGRYASTGCTVANVALLRQLEPFWHDLGYPLTLFCAHTVFSDKAACNVLARMRDHCAAEIAAHLHHWSTPPFGQGGLESLPGGQPQRSHAMSRDLLEKRLENLMSAARDFQSGPVTSFRMGRWDLKASLRPILAGHGINVDSSVCPLRVLGDGPDFFLAPPDPYWVEGKPGQQMLEIPITQVPLFPWLARAWHCAAGHNRGWLDSFHFWAALSANPVWHNAQVMRMATRLHTMRGGRVLSLFWHSSEMLAGASPNVRDEAAARALLAKIGNFLAWLRTNFDVQPITASGLHRLAVANRMFGPRPAGPGDW